ncbi:hypothetical protein V6Z12_D11G333500 [Gossypium hirsutum]|uniref:AUGMIN subunit 1 isoform X1 n=2 Tax=Gossypium hirsutum TaxID=3635 RepID=A0ABM3B154_GOSHI|nr:AUGMIN subunit 1-like isoform X1 [Gossypium hirsutum]
MPPGKKSLISNTLREALLICTIWLPSRRQRLKLPTLLPTIFARKPPNTVLKALLNRVGYTPEINHGVLVEMAEHRKDLEKKTKPILDTLRSYQDLPPDKALAALAIEDKKRQYTAAEKYLEDVLQSALATSD